MPDKSFVIAGIDEAGRGAVLGPLVIAGLSIEIGKEEELRKLGVRDSKDLSPKRREAIAEKLEKTAKDIIVISVEPCKIDSYKKEGINLNKLEALRFGEIINFIGADRVLIDSPENDTEKLKLFLEKMLKKDTELVVEHKADSNYLVVGAASIMAKVKRDDAIKKLSKKYGEVGSGYPSDERTIHWMKEWLNKNKEFPDCVRRSWATTENIENERKQSRLACWLKRKD